MNAHRIIPGPDHHFVSAAHLHAASYTAGIGHMPIPLMSRLKRVFLLEDNEANAMVFEAFLETVGCMSMDCAETLEAAEHYVDGITSGLYDLVVLDVMLPDGESTSFARRIAAKAACPVAVYTAKTSAHDMMLYSSVGVAHVFSKPLSLDAFKDGLSILDLD